MKRSQLHRFGTVIHIPFLLEPLEERATWLGGELDICEPEAVGTRIVLSFNISSSNNDTTKANLTERLNHV